MQGVQRSVRLLFLSVALGWIGALVSASLGSVIVLRLTNSPTLSGVPYFIVALGSALSALPAGHFMDRLGRVPVLVAGHFLGAVAFLVGLIGLRLEMFWLFLLGIAISSVAAGSTYLTRLAAADLYPKARRARGVSIVIFGAVAGVLVGTPLLAAIEPLAARWGLNVEETAWALAAFTSSLAAIVVHRIRPDPRTVAAAIALQEPQEAELERNRDVHWPPIIAAALALMFAQAAMVSVMSITGAALTLHGHTTTFITFTMTLHFVGMFLFAPVIGPLGDRYGRRALLVASGVIIAASGLALTRVPLDLPYSIVLFAIGAGWCLAFIGATAAIADHVPVARRGRVIGLVDFASAGAGALGALAAGGVLEKFAVPGVGLFATAAAIVVLLSVPLSRGSKTRASSLR